MTKKSVRIVIYFLLFALPILGMMNCSGWNEGSGAVKSCIIDFGIARSYAEIYYMLLLISAFLLGIPLVVYVLGAVAITELGLWLFSWLRKKRTPQAS